MKQTKQSILDAASRLVLKNGVKNTSLRDVAAELGISLGTLTYQFPTREELFFQMLCQHLETRDQRLLDFFSIKDREKRHMALVEYFSENAEILVSMELYYYLLSCSLSKDSALYAPLCKQFNLWKDQFLHAPYQSPGKTPQEQEADAHFLYLILNGMALSALYNDGSFVMEDMVDRLMEITDRL